MPKSTLKQKFKRLYDNQEREIEEAKKEISNKYKPLREELYQREE